MSMYKIFIISGTKEQAKLCARRYFLADPEFVIVNTLEDIMYCKDSKEIWFTGTYFMNKETRRITEYCKDNNLSIYMK